MTLAIHHDPFMDKVLKNEQPKHLSFDEADHVIREYRELHSFAEETYAELGQAIYDRDRAREDLIEMNQELNTLHNKRGLISLTKAGATFVGFLSGSVFATILVTYSLWANGAF